MSESNYGIPEPGPLPQPTEEHQQKITREKWFEIGTVIALIVAGAVFLAYREAQSRKVEAAKTLADAATIIAAAGCKEEGGSTLFNQQFLSFTEPLDDFTCHVDLVGKDTRAPLDLFIAWLTPIPGKAAPTPDSLQKAVNSVGKLGQDLVESSGEALQKASKTMTFVSDTKRPHDKGVAGTDDGWKVTYVTYHSFDETGEPQPMLCYIVHRLSAASDDGNSPMNTALYAALKQGLELKPALRQAEESAAASAPK